MGTTSSPNHVIEVQNLVKRYRSAKENSVDGISFYVEEGSFFSFLGPNGAGKTTTISILTTLLSLTSGTATIAGHDVVTEPDAVRRQIGVIFQNPSLDLNLTAEENVRFHANLYGLYPYLPTFNQMPAAYRKQIGELAEVVGLKDDLFKPVKSLSGGMKRKLEIIRSLMHKPRVLFLDEPTTGLDPLSRQNLWKYLQEIRQAEGVTIFLTTHYLDEAEGADYICIINHGKIVSQGKPREIKASLVREYVLMDAMPDQRAVLKKELTSHHFEHSGDGPFQVSLGKKSAQSIIQPIKTPLTLLEIHQPSLEEAYIEIIGNGGNHAR